LILAIVLRMRLILLLAILRMRLILLLTILRVRLILLLTILRVRLILLLTILRARLIVAAAMTLIIALMTALPVLPTLGATALRIIGQRLRSDTDTQQTNSGQTPDARLHAFPHCGLGPVRKTGNAPAGSATGYQSRNLFIEPRQQIADKKKGRPVGLPL
jgi:hypothetical protein